MPEHAVQAGRLLPTMLLVSTLLGKQQTPQVKVQLEHLQLNHSLPDKKFKRTQPW